MRRARGSCSHMNMWSARETREGRRAASRRRDSAVCMRVRDPTTAAKRDFQHFGRLES